MTVYIIILEFGWAMSTKGAHIFSFHESLWIIVQTAQILQIPKDFWYLINMTFQHFTFFAFPSSNTYLLSFLLLYCPCILLYHLFFCLFLSHLFPIHLLFGHCLSCCSSFLSTIFLLVLVNILDLSNTITVNNKQFQVNIANGLPKVYHPNSAFQKLRQWKDKHMPILI